MATGLPTLHLVENESGRKVRFTYKGVTITGYTATVHVKNVDGTIVSKPGVIIAAGPPDGIFEFTFAPGDLDASDTLLRPIEFSIVDTGGAEITFPAKPGTLFVLVRNELA